jgi:hypothetical protein
MAQPAGWTNAGRRGTSAAMSRYPALLILFAALASLAGTAEARLVGERSNGVQRICIYENDGRDRTRTPLLESIVGQGEPCPTYYRRPRPTPAQQAREERAVIIPSLALLRNQALVRGEKVCTYEYGGRNYERRLSISETCPLTPNFIR